MKISTRWALALVAGSLLSTTPALAQKKVAARDDAAIPPAAGAERAAPAATPDEAAEPEEKVKDGFRLRGGFSLNGGLAMIPGSDATGPAVGLGVRLGAQINHHFGVYYQNTPMVTLLSDAGGVAAGFVDYNTLLPTLTLLHTIELSAGPSVDFVAAAGCDGEACGSGSTVAFGTHGRLALNIGGLSGQGPRRSGFALGADIHPVFLDGAVLMTMTGGVGAEWY